MSTYAAKNTSDVQFGIPCSRSDCAGSLEIAAFLFSIKHQRTTVTACDTTSASHWTQTQTSFQQQSISSKCTDYNCNHLPGRWLQLYSLYISRPTTTAVANSVSVHGNWTEHTLSPSRSWQYATERHLNE